MQISDKSDGRISVWLTGQGRKDDSGTAAPRCRRLIPDARTGQWADIGKVKSPILRGLASRAPYFHNGSAGSLPDVLTFYDKGFNIGFTAPGEG
jgi:cytochrome c peroxidase